MRVVGVHYQLDFESIFNRRRRDLTPRSTENLYLRTLPALARYTLKPRCKPKLFQRSFTKNLAARQSLRKNLKKLLRERKKCVIIPTEEYLNAKMRSAVRQSAFSREGHHRLGVTRTQSCMHFPAEQTRSKTASSRVRSATVIQPRVRAPLGRARIKVVTRRILLLRPFSGWGAFLFRSSPPAASAGSHSGKPFGRARPMN